MVPSGMLVLRSGTREILVHALFERQVEPILEQVKKALEAAGVGNLDHVPKRTRADGRSGQAQRATKRAPPPAAPPPRAEPELPFDVEAHRVAAAVTLARRTRGSQRERGQSRLPRHIHRGARTLARSILARGAWSSSQIGHPGHASRCGCAARTN